MDISTYATFEVMHGRKSSLPELAKQLQPFARESIIYFCSAIGLILKLWQRGDWDRTHYQLLVRSVFEPLRADWYCFSLHTGSPEIVFHRRQLLLIMKLAIEHCPEQGLEVLDSPPGLFGTICLMANDQFHYGLYPFPKKHLLVDRDKIMRVLTEFVAVTEYAGSRLENKIVRAHSMMTRHVKNCEDSADFVDIAGEYEQLSGINFGDYEALTFGLFSRCNMVGLQALQKDARVAEIREENFHTTAIPQDVIGRFFAEFSIPPTDVLKQIKERDFGTNDFTVFRDKPLIKELYGNLASDVLFVGEKFEAGPYWKISSSNRKKGDRLRRFWGHVFESYVGEQLTYAAKLSKGVFVPNPSLPENNAAEICDGLLLDGDKLVVLEYKSSMFTAEAKYSGDHVRLLDEIAKKLIRDDSEKKKKGVEQIADGIKHLFAARDHKPISQIDLTRVRHVYPLLITLDSLGSTVLLSTLLNTYFDEFLQRSAFASWSIRPLFCIDIETLEEIVSFGDMLPVSLFLQHWLDSDEKLAGTLMAFPPSGLPGRRNEILWAEWQALSKELEARLFPLKGG